MKDKLWENYPGEILAKVKEFHVDWIFIGKLEMMLTTAGRAYHKYKQ